MAKNRFAISTVFDIDERPFNQGIRNTTGTVNVLRVKQQNVLAKWQMTLTIQWLHLITHFQAHLQWVGLLG